MMKQLAMDEAAHHTSKKRGSNYSPGINTISPLIKDKVATLKTKGHCMLENIKCTKIINLGQSPVDCSDQSVFALTKELKFRFLKMFQNYFLFFRDYISNSLYLFFIVN